MAATGNELVSLSQLKEYMDNKLCPVNSLYLSIDDTSPASIVGGVWERLEEGFLYSSPPPSLVRLERSPLAQMDGLLVRPRGLRLELRFGSESHKGNIDREDVGHGSNG